MNCFVGVLFIVVLQGFHTFTFVHYYKFNRGTKTRIATICSFTAFIN